MSGSASVTNTFQSQSGAIPLSQLDTNFTDITGYQNNPTNRYNFGTDTGIANTVSLTLVPAVLGYTAGLTITFKAVATNTQSAAININQVGIAGYLHPDLTSLNPGDITAGHIYQAIYDGTQFIHLAVHSPATAAQTSAAVTLVPYITPGRMQNHPGVSKAWATWIGTATGTISALASYNVSSIVRTGTGTYSIAFTTSFADTNYPVIVNVPLSAIAGPISGTRKVGGIMVGTATSNTGVAVDAADPVTFSAFGNQ